MLALSIALLAATAVPGAATVADPDAEVAALDEEVDEAKARAAAAEQTLEQLAFDLVAARDELVAVQGRLADAEARLRMLDGQLVLAERELDARRDEAAIAAARADAAADRQTRAEQELADEEERLENQMALSYMHGTTARPMMMLQMIEDTEDPGNLAADVYRLGVVLDTQAQLVARVDELRVASTVAAVEAREERAAADAAAATAAAAVVVAEDLRAQAAVVRADLAADRDRRSALLASLEADAEEQQAVLASVEAELAKLEAEREVAIAAAIAAKSQPAPAPETGGGGGGGALGADGPCPVDGAVAGRDFTNDWGHPRSGGRSHEGTDIFANRGTPVRAIANGTVKEVRHVESGLGGRVVSIWTATGVHWYYAHLESVAGGLSVGAPVQMGQILGTVGDSGNARGTPPHLHIGNYVDGWAQNPYPLLDVRCR